MIGDEGAGPQFPPASSPKLDAVWSIAIHRHINAIADSAGTCFVGNSFT